MNDRWRGPGALAVLDTGLPALTILFGLQTLRFFVPTVLNYLGVQPGMTTIVVGLYAIGVFALGLLAGVLHRLLGTRLSLIITTGGLGILRLWLQMGTAPGLTLLVSTVAVALFLWFLPIWLGRARQQGGAAVSQFTVAILLGLALDTALHGAAGTYDLAWQQDVLPGLTIAALVALQLALLVRTMREPDIKATDAALAPSLVLLGLGPFLFLEQIIFQNIARFTVFSGWSLPLAFGWIVLVNAAAVAVAIVTADIPRRGLWTELPDAIILVLVVAITPHGIVAAVALLLGQIFMADMLGAIIEGAGSLPVRPGLWRTAVAAGLSMLFFAILVFVYYIRYDLRLPFDNPVILILAAIIMSICAQAAVNLPPEKPAPKRSATMSPAYLALALLVPPAVLFLVWGQPKAVAGQGFPIRAMTYNLHYSFDTDGRLSLERLARTIEQEHPDAIGLQEVSRGWYVAGSADTLSWLSHRLNMPYVFAPAADAIWGNAILSRLPITASGYVPLPWFGEPLKRSYLWAQLDLGNGDSLFFSTLHDHHLDDGSAIRQAQVAAALKEWNKNSPALIVGDFNATPDTPEIALMRQAGLIDAWTQGGSGPGLTFISSGPYQRIDYIWLTPDLHAGDAANQQSTASDHLPVAATIAK